MNSKVKESLIQVLYEQIGVEIKNEDYRLALSTLEKLVELCEDVPNNKLYGGIQGYYAIIYKYLEKYTPALKAAQAALQFYEEKEDHVEIFRYRKFLGEFYYHFCKYDEAIEEWEQAIEVAGFISNGRDILASKGEVHLKLGELLLTLSCYKLARSNFVKGLSFGRSLSDAALIRRGQLGVGLTYHLENQFQLASKFYFRTLKQARQDGDQLMVGQILHSLGDIYTKTGQLERALKVYRKSLDISESGDDFLTSASTLREIGRIYLKLAPEKTLVYSERALDLLIENITSETRGDCERLMGKIFYLTAMYYYKHGDMKKAMNNLVEAGEIFHRFSMQKEIKRSQALYKTVAGRPVQTPVYSNSQTLMSKLGIG